MKHIHAKIACAVLGAAFAVGIGTSLTYGESPEIASPSPSLRKAIETRAVDETLVTTFDSGEVVSGSTSYQAYSNENWGITFGGNQKSLGTNKSKRDYCVLTGENAKYSVAGVTTASAIYNIKPLENIGRIALQYGDGKNNSTGVLYLLHSDDNVNFEQVNLTGEFAQGGSIGSTNTEYSLEFDALDGYFALVIADTKTSGDFRFDNVVAEFYSVSTTPIPDDVKPVSIALSAGEGKLSYYAGYEFDPTGFEVSLTYGSESDPSYASTSSLEVDDSRLTWNYDLTTVGEGKELTVTFTEGDVELTSNALVYDVLEDPMTHAISDTLTADDLAATGPYSYADFSKVEKDTGTVYAGSSAKSDAGAIQLRSKESNSGIVMTSSVSKAVGIELTFNSSTVSERVVEVYGQSTPYSSASDLYGGSSPIAEIAYSDRANQLIVFDQPYDYIGIRSKSGALYLDKVTFYFEEPEPSQAEYYAEMFLESMTCDGEKGAITAEEGTWEVLSGLYSDLSDSDKRILKEATPDENSEFLVEQAVARYDYIVGKYGVEQYPDFMGRTPARIAEARSVDVNDQTAAWVIAGISVAGIASAAAFFFLRRRKEA